MTTPETRLPINKIHCTSDLNQRTTSNELADYIVCRFSYKSLFIFSFDFVFPGVIKIKHMNDTGYMIVDMKRALTPLPLIWTNTQSASTQYGKK